MQSKSPLEFEVIATDGRARASRLKLHRHDCLTPMFMPVGTQGSVKGLTSSQLEELECQVILGNTYHLENKPGSSLLRDMGGLPAFMNWGRGTLTDSGGFQMVSLLDLADISFSCSHDRVQFIVCLRKVPDVHAVLEPCLKEEGVTFQSPVDGQQMLLTPERSMQIQNNIGADIIMALDDVVSSVCVDESRFEEATHRTLRWIDRCIAAHQNTSKQALFGIVQGGLNPRLRKICLEGLKERDDKLPGYAIGGLAGGEEKAAFCKVVSQCTAALPPNKPRYVMGVGYPLDLVICSALGADMYDCVYPSRTARFGTALVPEGVLRLKTSSMAADYRPIDSECDCLVCKRYTRAHLHAKITKDPHAASLLTYHNIRYQMRLCRSMHEAIVAQEFSAFVQGFVRRQFSDQVVPAWVREALEMAKIDI